MSECLSLKYYPVQVAGPVISSKQMILMDLPCGAVAVGGPRSSEDNYIQSAGEIRRTVDKYNELKHI